MPRYKIVLKVVEEVRLGTIVIEADSQKDARSRIEDDMDSEIDDAIEWEPLDMTKEDVYEVVSIQEVM